MQRASGVSFRDFLASFWNNGDLDFVQQVHEQGSPGQTHDDSPGSLFTTTSFVHSSHLPKTVPDPAQQYWESPVRMPPKLVVVPDGVGNENQVELASVAEVKSPLVRRDDPEDAAVRNAQQQLANAEAARVMQKANGSSTYSYY